MRFSAKAFSLIAGIVIMARGLQAGFYPGPGPRTAEDLCPHGYYNALAKCPEEFECAHADNCSSAHVCCRNACGTKTCIAPWIQEEITEDQSLCQNVTCEGQGEECLVFNGRTWCMCHQECEPARHRYQLVCDQNGTTHRSLCFLNQRACEFKQHLIPTPCVSLPGNIVIESEPITGPSFDNVFSEKMAVLGDTVRLPCRPNGNPRPTVYWQPPIGDIYVADPRAIRQDDRIFIDNANTLTIRGIQVGDGGNYVCHAASITGRAETSVQITVYGQSASSLVNCNTFPIDQAAKCKSGHGVQITHMWVYDRRKNLCIMKYFRDCPAITNKFESRDDCNSACVRDVCSLTLDRGPCNTFVHRIGYNTASRSCESFAYGGCGGNWNRFRDVASCERACGGRSHIRETISQASCRQCTRSLGKPYCRSDFIVIAKILHFRPNLFQKSSTDYILLEISEVLLDRTVGHRLKRRNLRNRNESKMHLRLDMDSNCPCPRLSNLPRTRLSTRHRLNRVGRSNDVTAIIAGTVVDGYPTLTSDGMAVRETPLTVMKLKNMIRLPGFCRDLSIVERQ